MLDDGTFNVTWPILAQFGPKVNQVSRTSYITSVFYMKALGIKVWEKSSKQYKCGRRRMRRRRQGRVHSKGGPTLSVGVARICPALLHVLVLESLRHSHWFLTGWMRIVIWGLSIVSLAFTFTSPFVYKTVSAWNMNAHHNDKNILYSHLFLVLCLKE